MKITRLAIHDVVLLQPQVFSDTRGYFFESFNHKKIETALNITVNFVQDNHSASRGNVVRGLHYQLQNPQGKLIRVIQGSIFDVAVDLRQSSSTFGKWVGKTISAENQYQLWIPEGFAHGFMTLTDTAEVLYKTTDYWSIEDECCIKWDCPYLAIDWPITKPPKISAKDQQGLTFDKASTFQ